MTYWLRMWYYAARYFLRNVKHDGPRRAAGIFWSNWKSRTHLYRTHVPPGMWSEPSQRLAHVIAEQLITYIEKQWASDQTRQEIIAHTHPDEVFCKPYVWFARDRARWIAARDHYGEIFMTDDYVTDVLRGSVQLTEDQKIARERYYRFDMHIFEQDREMYAYIGRDLHVMWT